jgi:hypothetical protein
VVPLKVDPDDKEFLEADVASRAEASTQEDYDNVPVEGFGLGMLLDLLPCCNVLIQARLFL